MGTDSRDAESRLIQPTSMPGVRISMMNSLSRRFPPSPCIPLCWKAMSNLYVPSYNVDIDPNSLHYVETLFPHDQRPPQPRSYLHLQGYVCACELGRLRNSSLLPHTSSIPRLPWGRLMQGNHPTLGLSPIEPRGSRPPAHRKGESGGRLLLLLSYTLFPFMSRARFYPSLFTFHNSPHVIMSGHCQEPGARGPNERVSELVSEVAERTDCL